MLAVSAAPSFSRVARGHTFAIKKCWMRSSKPSRQTLKWAKKKGELSGVFVHKFKLNNQETLLAYELKPHKNAPTKVMLLAVGSHENFYAALKR